MRSRLHLAIFTASLSLSALADAPQLPLSKAVAIAEQSLKERDLRDKVYIQSASLEKRSITNRESYWFIQWDRSLPAVNPRNREIGMKIRMDGTSVRLVKEPGAL